MTTFVLVHGAWHGAWCWDRLVPVLEARGHGAITMDLPIDDGTATFNDYADAVLAAAAGTSEEVVLVGHSLGAMVIPLVASRRPTAAMVLLCGVTPNLHGQPWDDAPQMELTGVFDPLVASEDGTTRWPDATTATQAFYNRCEPSDAEWAFGRLRGQNSRSLWDRSWPATQWPDVPTYAVSCTDDHAVSPAFARHTCHERLGVEPVEIPGDHSPFLSDPDALAEIFLRWV